MHKKRPKICTHYGDSAAKIYLYHSSKNTSSRPPLGLSSEYNSVQSFSGSCIEQLLTTYEVNTKILHKLQSTFGSCSNFAINLWVRMHLQFLQNTYFTYFFLLSWEIHEQYTRTLVHTCYYLDRNITIMIHMHSSLYS